jgi:hypothetical protein
MIRKHLRSLLALLLALVLFNSASVHACGPFLLEAVFVHTVHPTYPLERFAAGRIGVLQPTYARSYLSVAYRYLLGSSFTPSEQKAVTELWKERLNLQWLGGEEEWVKTWFDARRKVAGQDPAGISVYRSREKPFEYESYLNCQKETFDTAVATLNERIAKYGADSAEVKTWVYAQDQVFSNCGGGSFIPDQLPSEADALMRADRAYQIAAANFYATKFDEAAKGFQAIAADSQSPWQQIAIYLVARALARKGSLGPLEQKQESLGQAETQLQKILADRKLSSLHPASTRLLNLVRLRLRPVVRLHELANSLTAKNENQNLKQDLWDYTVLLDGFLEGVETKPPTGVRDDDLSDWIVTFQDSSKDAHDHALSRWQATHSTPWLIAALTHIDGKDSKASEILAEALKVKSGSAAFASARFQAIRLSLDLGRNTEARTLLDQSLKDRAQLDQSTLNLLVSKRMLLANSLPAFLADAARMPASLSWNDDGREIPSEEEGATEVTEANRGKPFFDVDAGHAINDQLPLSVLKEAAKSDALPPGTRRDLVQAVWLRAALFGDIKTADELAPILAGVLPEFAGYLNNYLSTTQPDEKKFTAIYGWLKFPGLEPVVDIGIGRATPLNQQDMLRDNWWCRSFIEPAEPEELREAIQFTAVPGPPPAFLSEAEIARGARESASLKALGTAPNYISRQVVDWANRKPNDPRVPEALHLAVRTTRYGCTDKETARWSKAAFDVLHRNYPNNPWTKKTPYWFKD